MGMVTANPVKVEGMEIALKILLILHLIGLAGLLGGVFLQIKDIVKDVATIPAGMVHSGWLMAVTGVMMFGLHEAMDIATMDSRIKIGVKTLILVVIMVLLMANRKKERVAAPIMWTIGALAVANICIAVLW